MKFNRLLPWLCCAALTVMAACSLAGTNSPGTIYLPGSVPGDHDATNFIARAGINPKGPEAKAVGKLIYDLKAANLWTNLYALYPFVGSTSNSCAQNLVSTNYGVTWSGTVTFNASGVTGDGASGSGDTGFIEADTGAATNDLHLYAYADTVQSAYSGAYVSAAQTNAWGVIGETSGNFAAANLNANDLSPSSFGSFGTGNILASRQSAGQNFLLGWPPWVNTNITVAQYYSTNSTAPTGVITNSMKLLGNPLVASGIYMQGYTKTTLRAASFGHSLTYSQATNYFAIMTAFRNTLNRTVGTLTP